jgi:hypothetical protein
VELQASEFRDFIQSFGTSDLGSSKLWVSEVFQEFSLSPFQLPNSEFSDFFTLRVHILQMSPTQVVAHGMSRKVHVTPGNVILPHHIFSFDFGTSGFRSLCINTSHFSRVPKL